MSTIPKKVFIVPYRNRPHHKFFFSNYVTTILKEEKDYEIYFAHQSDTRAFNRGATKNIGFLAIKNKYPEQYKDITFIFNDIDTIPFDNIFDFDTRHGVIKHYYGFEYALGGIVAIKGIDFEATNGYPNFWGWGMEDTILQKRCQRIHLEIDRSEFYPIGSPEILHLFDGISRLINTKDTSRASRDNGIDGIRTIHHLEYTVDEKSTNPLDNINTVESTNIYIINIHTFQTAIPYKEDGFYEYDLRESSKKMANPNRIKNNNLHTTTSNWSKIPFYPTTEQRKEMVHQYGNQTTEKIIEYNYQNSTDPTQYIIPPTNIIHHSIQRQPAPTPVNKYSPSYAIRNNIKPKASKSANIRLGGVY